MFSGLPKNFKFTVEMAGTVERGIEEGSRQGSKATDKEKSNGVGRIGAKKGKR